MTARTKQTLQNLRNRASLSGFARNEDGTITIFSVMMFVLMIGIGGIAIDVMRYETQRVQLQYTLDRAVLAAASMSNTLDPETVVRDYFEISGLENYRLTVSVEDDLNSRSVSADAQMDINSVFMHMFGVRALTSPGFGIAEEQIDNVEISMVLDISGSMRHNNKLTNMQTAARDFVTTVMEANDYVEDEMLVSVSIVPYNGRVNAGSTIESVFTLSDEHSRSSCTRFSGADFETTAIDPSQPVQRLAHFDLANFDSNAPNMSYRSFRRPHCQTNDFAAILPWSNSVSDLHAHINSFSAGGWTAIDLGMNWGVGLLDPAARPAARQLATQGLVHEDFNDRPLDYPVEGVPTDEDTMKIVVLMTDGENTRQYDITGPRRDGLSNVFYHEDHDRWSMYMPSTELYWIPDRGDRNWTNDGRSRPDRASGTYSTEPYRGDESDRVPWQYFWSRWSARMMAGEFYYEGARRWGGDWDYYRDLRYNTYRQYADQAIADANLRAICDAAHAQDIIVFTVAFEAPQSGAEVMEDCATSPSHYFDVNGLEIADAFASIATTINRLRLVQ